MKPEFFGTEEVVETDRAYNGATFSEVKDALFANPYQGVWGGKGEPALPIYEVTLSSVLRGILPHAKPYLFRQATERAVDSHADLRWGPDGKGFRRLLHPNGVCLTGLWEITEETEYSGYFRKGSRALVWIGFAHARNLFSLCHERISRLGRLAGSAGWTRIGWP